MKLKGYLVSLVLVCLLLTITTACDDLFEFSPYTANVSSGDRNTTAKNLQRISNIQLTTNSFSFAFIADNHYYYDNLRSVVNDINGRDDISFVIFGGDIADQALLKEYELFYDIMKKLNKPYLTVIGNHDYNSNGEVVYKQMFGDYNYSFEFKNNKFVLFDNVVWESNRTPDFDWLTAQLTDNDLYNQVFVISHIPPFGDQTTGEISDKHLQV
jgi:Icc protein